MYRSLTALLLTMTFAVALAPHVLGKAKSVLPAPHLLLPGKGKSVARPDNTPVAATKAAPLAWRDLSGKSYTGADVAGAKATVFFFTSTECPIAAQYTGRMAELNRDYATKGVRFFLVNSNTQDTSAKFARYARERNINFPIVKDNGTALADRLNAQTTPSAVIVDSAGETAYLGRIDDSTDRAKVTREDVRMALDSLLAGKPIALRRTRVVGCAIFRERATVAKTGAKITYAHDVAPILNQNCVNCHRAGEVAPFALENYQQAKVWASAIKEYTGRRIMPPWKAIPEQSLLFHDARFLTDAQIQTIAHWADAGAPQGDPKQTPPLPHFGKPGDWMLGKPDVVLQARPFHLEAEGKDVYRDFALPIDFTQDRYVSAMDVIPGNRKIVHHIIAYIDTTGETVRAQEGRETEPGWSVAGGGSGVKDDEWGMGWAPGMTPRRYPTNIALFIPKGSKLVMQVHYHKSGRPEVDQSKLAIYWANQAPEKVIHTVGLGSPFIGLKPGVANQEVKAWLPVPFPSTIYEVLPHMHMLGKDMEVTAKLPDGTIKSIITVKNWDFNWQIGYRFKKPIQLPAWSQLFLRATYDNTAENPNQPSNPPQFVHFGEQTTDEMCFAFLGFTRDDEPKSTAQPRFRPRRNAVPKG